METLEDLSVAERGSFYTIRGIGGDLAEWEEGIPKVLREAEIGTPTALYLTTGEAVNAYVGTIPNPERDKFPDDLLLLMFPLDGLNIVKLALFRLMYGDIWFDDMVRKMRKTVRHSALRG